jgi:hypothetical protein
MGRKRYDYSSVDWTRPTEELMREHGLSKSTVLLRRHEYAPETVRGYVPGYTKERKTAYQARYYAATRAERIAWQLAYNERRRGGPAGKVGRPKKTT